MQDPIIVVTLNATQLGKVEAVANLKTLAQVLRGKLNLINNVSGRSNKMRIVLTHNGSV
ncbi:MAG: hypothetical protein ACI9S8_002579 [Chlamydiales bacterium]|jgi:hypothetical protein